MKWTVDNTGYHTYHESDESEVEISVGCHTLFMEDGFGDGWNGATWTLKTFTGDVIAGPFTFTVGYSAAESFCIEPALQTSMGSFEDFPFEGSFVDLVGEDICDVDSAPKEGMFCDFEQGASGTFEPCSKHVSIGSCHNDGLPILGTTSCANSCFPGVPFVPEIIHGTCAVEITIDMSNGDYADEIDWVVADMTGAQAHTHVDNYVESTVYTETIYLAHGSYTFIAKDMFGDGWNGGSYSIRADDGEILLADTAFAEGYEQSSAFTINCNTEFESVPTSPPTAPPTMAACVSPDDIASTACDGITAYCGHEEGKQPECYCLEGYHHIAGQTSTDKPTSCELTTGPTPMPTAMPTTVVLEGIEGEYAFKVVMASGWYPSEMRWRIDGGGVHTFYSSEHMTLDMPIGQHTLYMEDTFGDGWNDGTFELQVDGICVVGPFAFSDGFTNTAEFEVTAFDYGIPSPPDANLSPSTPCGCEVDGESFCNFESGPTGICEPCSRHTELSSCNDDGLPLAGAIDCVARCFVNGEHVEGAGSYADEASNDSFATPADQAASILGDTTGIDDTNYYPSTDGGSSASSTAGAAPTASCVDVGIPEEFEIDGGCAEVLSMGACGDEEAAEYCACTCLGSDTPAYAASYASPPPADEGGSDAAPVAAAPVAAQDDDFSFFGDGDADAANPAAGSSDASSSYADAALVGAESVDPWSESDAPTNSPTMLPTNPPTSISPGVDQADQLAFEDAATDSSSLWSSEESSLFAAPPPVAPVAAAPVAAQDDESSLFASADLKAEGESASLESNTALASAIGGAIAVAAVVIVAALFIQRRQQAAPAQTPSAESIDGDCV
jgi:hypothetical protein